MKTYKVYVHYEGCFDYEIEAEDSDSASEIAEERFYNEPSDKLADNLADYFACDCFEIKAKGKRKC